MRKVYFLVFFIFIAFSITAQVPQAFKYQAIARDDAGNILPSWDIGLRISIVEKEQDGQAVYVETQQVKSNLYGLITLAIGEGNVMTGDFGSITWGDNKYFIKVEMDINGEQDFKEMGTTQLYAVPYALYAEKAGGIVETERKQLETGRKNPHINLKTNGGNRSGTPNTKFPAKGHSFTNIDYGNLGVGTTTPVEKLEVNGNIKANILFLTDSKGNQWELVIDTTGGFHILDRFAQCGDSLYDFRDGRYYQTVLIGVQCWMADNLNMGDRIDGGTDQTDNGDIEKYCFSNLEIKCDTFGGLYQWNEMMQYTNGFENNGICPQSWHVPTKPEWDVMINLFGGGNFAGGAMKITGTQFWKTPNTGATNSSGFTGLGAGQWDYSTGGFHHIRELGLFWSGTDDGGTNALRIITYHNKILASRTDASQESGFSVRCIKNFECGDSLIDYQDGKKYGTILIGTQCWMSQNLNVGNRINGIDNQIDNGNIEKYCYDDLETNCDEYGGLYQWDEMMQYVTTEGTRGICPEGFHLPTDAEFKVLEGNVDSHFGVGSPEWDPVGDRGFDVGYHLKSTTGWDSGGNGDDYFGFTALPVGFRTYSGVFGNLGGHTTFWLSTENIGSNRTLYFGHNKVNRSPFDKMQGFSVRCLQDE